ncbi:MFS transporter [Rhizobium sp. PAMB 3182]
MISRLQVFCLGLTQLVSWGISYYLIGTFAGTLEAERGWSMDAIYGGFAAALIVMGLTSALTGRLIDTFGGRWIMSTGALLIAVGCTGIAVSHSLAGYYASWLILGLAMRLSLYDAAFAALVKQAGPAARQPIAQITLLGGLASTVFWPIGHYLSDFFGLTVALFCYAAFALCTIPLYLVALVAPPRGSVPEGETARAGLSDIDNPASKPRSLVPAILYAVIVAATNSLSAGLTSHLIGILDGLGMATVSAVWIASLPGIAQSTARFTNLVIGRKLNPLSLNLIAASVMPIAFLCSFFSGWSMGMAAIFVALFGAANGLLTITRGSLPLVLFDDRHYGRLVGKLITPSFFLSAASPLVYAMVIERAGDMAALVLSLVLAVVIFAAAVALKVLGQRSKVSGAS